MKRRLLVGMVAVVAAAGALAGGVAPASAAAPRADSGRGVTIDLVGRDRALYGDFQRGLEAKHRARPDAVAAGGAKSAGAIPRPAPAPDTVEGAKPSFETKSNSEAIRDPKAAQAKARMSTMSAEAVTAGYPYDYINSIGECTTNAASDDAYGWVKNHFAFCTTFFFNANRTARNSAGAIIVTGQVGGRVTILSENHQGDRNNRTLGYVTEVNYAGDATPSNVVLNLGLGAVAANETPNAQCHQQNTQVQSKPAGSWNTTTGFGTWTMDIPTTGTVGRDLVGACQIYPAISATSNGMTSNWLMPRGGNFVECDSAPYIRYGSATYAQGCIFSYVTPMFSYSLSDTAVDETARHIFDAFTSPGSTYPPKTGKSIPGQYGSATVLQRLYPAYDQTRYDANRSTSKAACVQYFPGYSTQGKDCDEYPFASTFQGAALGNGNYSVRAVTSSDNQTAGSRLGVWYGFDRIRHERRFQIRITS
jgi:hypothetical protein